MGYFIKKDKHGTEGLVLPSGPTTDRPATPVTASVRYNTDTQSVEYFDGTNFVDIAKTGSTTITRDSFIGDGVTTTFTMSKQPNTNHHVLVFVNGVYQTPPTHYTVSGFDITFTSPVPNNLRAHVIHGLGDTYVAPGDVFDVPSL